MRAFKRQFAALVSFALISCATDGQLSMVADVDPIRWREAAEFTLLNSDTLSVRDISIFARYQPTGERIDSLPLHIVTVAPNKARVVEQFTLQLKNRVGDQWRRRVFYEAPYRHEVKLRQSGEYKILIYPQSPQSGVEAIGIAVKSR
ncbi:MAG: hypothetical protein R3Y39_01710 [Rikenellaceae bacterium]